ncbi:MAG: DUF3429 domain-containing protein [Burkholderiaceae bacterium]
MNKDAYGGPGRLAQALGLGGLIPFVGLALASWAVAPAHQPDVLRALTAYAATIASFVGALHWGAAMHQENAHASAMLVWGVLPSLIAWAALLLAPLTGLLLLALLLALCYGVDQRMYPRIGLSRWLALRLRLSATAVASCLVAALSTRV